MSDTLASALQNAKSFDSEAKQKMARYTDVKKKAKPSMVKVGDKVLLQQKQQHKLSTRYDCRPRTVIARRGPSIVLQRGDEAPIMRNVSLVYKIPNETNSEEDVDFGEGRTQGSYSGQCREQRS